MCQLVRLFLGVTLIESVFSVAPLKGPPLFEGKPNLLDSYVPAAMQIIAHLTDLMKYDLRPSSDATTTTTSTVRPTPSHKPGLYAPVLPPGPEAFFAKGTTYEEYIQNLQNTNYFDRYRFPPNARSLEEIPETIDVLVGPQTGDLVRLVNRLDDDFSSRDDDQLERFFQKYDDTDPRVYLRQKKVPPTRAYVTLLSLYDLLNKESKKLGLNKYNGYSPEVLKVLTDTSTGTSASQLKTVLTQLLEKRNTKDPSLINKITTTIKDLDKDDSYMNDALRYIPPLQFAL